MTENVVEDYRPYAIMEKLLRDQIALLVVKDMDYIVLEAVKQRTRLLEHFLELKFIRGVNSSGTSLASGLSHLITKNWDTNE